MPLVPDRIAFQEKLAALPVTTYPVGDDVLTAGSSTGRLLILKRGAVEVVKEGVHIANVSIPGVVFGELAALLGRPNTADVRAWNNRRFTSPTRRHC
jgi:CRP/FNR family transcriptional regulator, cyclic AMP receptor protein